MIELSLLINYLSEPFVNKGEAEPAQPPATLCQPAPVPEGAGGRERPYLIKLFLNHNLLWRSQAPPPLIIS